MKSLFIEDGKMPSPMTLDEFGTIEIEKKWKIIWAKQVLNQKNFFNPLRED